MTDERRKLIFYKDINIYIDMNTTNQSQEKISVNWPSYYKGTMRDADLIKFVEFKIFLIHQCQFEKFIRHDDQQRKNFYAPTKNHIIRLNTDQRLTFHMEPNVRSNYLCCQIASSALFYIQNLVQDILYSKFRYLTFEYGENGINFVKNSHTHSFIATAINYEKLNILYPKIVKKDNKYWVESTTDISHDRAIIQNFFENQTSFAKYVLIRATASLNGNKGTVIRFRKSYYFIENESSETKLLDADLDQQLKYTSEIFEYKGPYSPYIEYPI